MCHIKVHIHSCLCSSFSWQNIKLFATEDFYFCRIIGSAVEQGILLLTNRFSNYLYYFFLCFQVQRSTIACQEVWHKKWNIPGPGWRRILDVDLLCLLPCLLVRHSSHHCRREQEGWNLHSWSAPHCKSLSVTFTLQMYYRELIWLYIISYTLSSFWPSEAWFNFKKPFGILCLSNCATHTNTLNYVTVDQLYEHRCIDSSLETAQQHLCNAFWFVLSKAERVEYGQLTHLLIV